MRDFVLTFGVSTNRTLGEAADADADARTRAIYQAAFELGPAWMGGQRAVFFKTDLTIDEVMTRLTELIGGADSLLVVELTPRGAARYAGWLVDAEGFEVILPDAVETALPGRGRLIR